jgi:hypothetical protein
MGLQPSPLVGELLAAVYELQLDGRVRTLEEAKEAARTLIEEARTLVEDKQAVKEFLRGDEPGET